MKAFNLLAGIAVLLFFTACESSSPTSAVIVATDTQAVRATRVTQVTTPEAGPAAEAIQRYLHARVAHDINTAIALSCGDWEQQARIEIDSLRADATLEALQCQQVSTSGATALVACSGRILTSYSGEKRELDLSRRQFRAIFQANEWLMCGYA